MTDLTPDQWLRRLDATGRAQDRYLWIILLTGLFYFALRFSNAGAQAVSVPLISLTLDATAVLAAGGTVLAFEVLSAIGALMAWTNALRSYAPKSWRDDAERLDTHPNALDLAIYAMPGGSASVRTLRTFVYPAYLGIALVESAWLQCWLWRSAAPARCVFLLLGFVVWLRATWLLLGIVQERFDRARESAQWHSL